MRSCPNFGAWKHNFIKVFVMLVQVPGIVELPLYYMFPQIGQIINPIEHLWVVYIYLHFMIMNCNHFAVPLTRLNAPIICLGPSSTHGLKA